MTKEIYFITFKDLFLNYLDRKDTTKNSYLIILNSFTSYLNSRNITDPKRNDVLKYKEELLKRLSSASI
ncbi:MAG: hypothetical protein LBV58_04515 [Acholeplasmatales bacterium]|jgi:hypothetical protein|nr:hypothetical protein [Acholeplasmatales bacterium]